ncbi:MAG: molybdopterin cofactor-binding domain-containing protein, partial [Oscillospiraceae bacterium]
AAPASPEPPGAIVRWEGGRDFTVWCDTQSGYICKITNASVITDCNMDIHTFNVGGSYGNKQSQVQIVSSAAVLSMKTGRPVKFYQTKAEQMCCFETRLGSQVHAKIGMDKDGVVKAVKAEWTVDTGCLSNATQGQIGVGIGEAQLVMCKCPNWDLDTNLVVTNMPCWAPSARRKARRCRCALSGSRRLRRCFPLLRPGHPLRPRRPYRAAQGIR